MVLLSVLLARRSVFLSAVCLTQAQESSDKLPRAPLPRWEKVEARGLPSRPHCSICMKAHVRDETEQILSSRGLEQCLDIAGALQTLVEGEREGGWPGHWDSQWLKNLCSPRVGRRFSLFLETSSERDF